MNLYPLALLLRRPLLRLAERREPDESINGGYLLRWHLRRSRARGNVYLHCFKGSDDGRALHDHPWWSLSLGLVGGTREFSDRTFRGGRDYRELGIGSVVLRPPTFAHRLELPGSEPAWTLFVTGPKVREWGFLCPGGWRHWQDFHARGCD